MRLSGIIIAALALATPPFPAVYAAMPGFPFVYADGHATTDLPPDIATIDFHVLAYDPDPGAALSVVHQRSAELVLLFAQHAIADDDIVSYEIDKHAVRQETDDFDELEILGYDLSRRFQVTLRDLDRYTAFMTALYAADNVADVTASFDRTDRKQIETGLIAQATADARRKAATMAQGAGSELGPVYALSESGFGGVLTRFGLSPGIYGDIVEHMMLRATRVEEQQLFIPATVTFSSTVHVIYQLKPHQP